MFQNPPQPDVSNNSVEKLTEQFAELRAASPKTPPEINQAIEDVITELSQIHVRSHKKKTCVKKTEETKETKGADETKETEAPKEEKIFQCSPVRSPKPRRGGVIHRNENNCHVTQVSPRLPRSVSDLQNEDLKEASRQSVLDKCCRYKSV